MLCSLCLQSTIKSKSKHRQHCACMVLRGGKDKTQLNKTVCAGLILEAEGTDTYVELVV